MLQSIQSVDLNVLSIYVNCLGKCGANYHRRFVETYFPKFEQAVKQKILNATTAELRNVKKE
jgi:hypothetical protein